MSEPTNKTLSPTLDPKSPYYLTTEFQPSDFSIPKLTLTEDNYIIWKRRFLNFLQLSNKTGFIDGTLQAPYPSSPLFQPWKQINNMITLWIKSLITEDLQDYVMFYETAHGIWEALRQLFDLKIYETRHKIAMMRQGDDDSVEEYFGEMRMAWMELEEYDPLCKCKCGGCKCKEGREKEERYAFLRGLNKSLSNVRSCIMLKKPCPSLFEVFRMVKDAESMMRR